MSQYLIYSECCCAGIDDTERCTQCGEPTSPIAEVI